MMQSIEIRKIPFSRPSVKKFITFAWDIYKDDPYWVPPLIRDQLKLLNPQKNPFFDHSEAHLIGAYQNDKMVGRLAVGINRSSNEYRNENVAFFGFFEAINDQRVASALFDHACTWAKQKGVSGIRGPFSLTINDECGLLIDGFDTDPYIMMTHNPRYYQNLIEGCNFHKAMDGFAFESHYDTLDKPLGQPLLQIADHVEKTLKPTLRPLDKGKNFMRDVHTAMGIINESLSRNWAACPMTDAEIKFKAADLKAGLVPDLCFFVELEGKPVGFNLTIPNYNVAIKKANGRLFPFGLLKILWHSRKIKTVRAIQLGMIKKYQGTGLGAYCYVELHRQAAKRGIMGGEMSWVMEDNQPTMKAAALLGGKPYKTYRWYEKQL